MKIVIIGGGILGLGAAYYLNQSGWQVTVLDKKNLLDNCSYGNAGYVCPSHFIPMATPGIVKQGLKWMFNSRSPFYIQPRLNGALIDWGLKFVRSATPEKVAAAAVPLRDIALLSQHEFKQWAKIPSFDFSYEHKGLLEIFQTEKAAEHARHTVEKGKELGLAVDLLDYNAMSALEPGVKINGRGAIFFNCDAHLYLNKLMGGLLALLKERGVVLIPNEEVTSFGKAEGPVKKILTATNAYEADAVVIATGSWSREIAALLQTRIPLMPGRGYSLTLDNSTYTINHPAILVEGKTAITPMDGNKIRFGDTMEITSTCTPPRMNRMQGILDAVKRFFPAFDIPLPEAGKIWYGYRPCSADGLPYIGRIKKWKNVVVATGHSMLGISVDAGTGKIVSELNEQPLSMDTRPFMVERFNG
ncbi:MAG: FAD-dependent oxidoreductase [Bacteroidota bacterium]